MQRCFNEKAPGQDLKSNVAVVAFVTSFALMELLEGMNLVGPERVLYVDTDCVFPIEISGTSTIPTGDGLGEFKNELGDDEIV